MRFFGERPASCVAALVVFFALVGACAATTRGARAPSDGAEGATALVVVHGAPQGAIVSVDDRPAHVVAIDRPGFAVEAGVRRLTVEGAGFLPFRYSGAFEAGAIYDLEVELWPCFVGVDSGCTTPDGSDSR